MSPTEATDSKTVQHSRKVQPATIAISKTLITICISRLEDDEMIATVQRKSGSTHSAIKILKRSTLKRAAASI
jgi:hypothetical protein